MKTKMMNLIKKYPFVFFLVITTIISWLPCIQRGREIFVFGPSTAGLITVLILYGKDGLKNLVKQGLKWRVKLIWWIIA